MKKILKYILIIIVFVPLLFIAIIWGTYNFYVKGEMEKESHIKVVDGNYCWGMGCRQQEKTFEEFLPVFQEQSKVMINAVNKVWPGIDFSPVKSWLINKAQTKAWVVSADGSIKNISVEKYHEHFEPTGYDMEFTFEKDKSKGMNIYMLVGGSEMKKQTRLEEYPYLGTYDPILTVIHEGFHHFVQDAHFKKNQDEIARVEILNQTETRIIRTWMIELLKKALISTDTTEKEKYLNQAKYFFEKYKNENPKEFKITKYFDRIEGTAHYVEIMTSLIWKNDGIYDYAEINKMLKSLYKNWEFAPVPGASNESYRIGGMAGFLLDEADRNGSWKKEVQNNPNTTPLILLLENYQPIESEIPESFKREMIKLIKEKEKIAWKPLVKFAYDSFFN